MPVSAVTTMFVSCNKTNPDGGEDENSPTSIGDPVSVKALTGNWTRLGYNNSYRQPFWVFMADGRFAYYRAVNLGGYPQEHYEYWMQGKYRVNGTVIECYECKMSSYFEYSTGSWRYFDELPWELKNNELIVKSLPDPLAVANFNMQFEFFNAKRMRLVFDLGSDHWDTDFVYIGDKSNMDFPDHILPGLAWPSILPADIPVFNDGRIRTVEGNSLYGSGIHIAIDKTTVDAVWDYLVRLIAADWSWVGYSFSSADDIEDWFSRGYSVNVRKGKYNLGIDVNIDDCFVIGVGESL